MFVIDPKGTLVYAGAIDDKPTTDQADVDGRQELRAARRSTRRRPASRSPWRRRAVRLLASSTSRASRTAPRFGGGPSATIRAVRAFVPRPAFVAVTSFPTRSRSRQRPPAYTVWLMAEPRPRLFTAHFFVMCGFSFTVFVSAFLLLPTAPFRILDLGGAPSAAGLFLGFLTYASALSAPVHRRPGRPRGPRRMLVVCSLAIAGFSLAYAFSPRLRGAARAGGRARRLLVGAALRLRRVHDRPAPREPAGGGHRLLGPLHDPRHRGGARARLLDLRAGAGAGCASCRPR